MKFLRLHIANCLLPITFCLLPVAYCFLPIGSFAQASKQKIAIFAPLFLDSAFDANNNYRYGQNFPKYINPGIEFYEGAQLALDTLAKEKQPLEIFVYDTRSASKTLQQQLAEVSKNSVQMIIACNAVNEIQPFAYAAQKMKIPFINVNLPNDGGVFDNPYFVMLNPTLKTHCESIYRYLQKNHALDEIIVLRKKGSVEDKIQYYFSDFGKHTLSVPLQMTFRDLADSFTLADLTDKLDSNRNMVCISGSLDENFGQRLAQNLAVIRKSYPVILIGMPTFDNLGKEFSKQEYKGLSIIYSTPFYIAGTDKVSQSINNYFNTKMYARPSDMVKRGYEATWCFTKLLLKYKSDIASHLTRKEFNVFREFDIQPVFSRQNMSLDYYENKKIFFTRWLNGLMNEAD